MVEGKSELLIVASDTSGMSGDLIWSQLLSRVVGSDSNGATVIAFEAIRLRDKLNVGARHALCDNAWSQYLVHDQDSLAKQQRTERNPGRHTTGAISASLAVNVFAFTFNPLAEPLSVFNTEKRTAASTICESNRNSDSSFTSGNEHEASESGYERWRWVSRGVSVEHKFWMRAFDRVIDRFRLPICDSCDGLLVVNKISPSESSSISNGSSNRAEGISPV